MAQKPRKKQPPLRALPKDPVVLNKIERAALEPAMAQVAQAEQHRQMIITEILMAHGLPAEAANEVTGWDHKAGALVFDTPSGGK
jgi:hypothetical protein